MSLLEDLYKQIILEHYKKPRNYGELEPHTHRQEGKNTSCGDEITLDLTVENGVIQEARFKGHGCAISQATASLMTEAIKGKKISEVQDLSSYFKNMLRTGTAHPELGELSALQGISKIHARVKCASLPWTTLDEALRQAETSN